MWLPYRCGRDKPPISFDENHELGFADNSKPVAILPRRHTPRIVAQRGVFTIHGTEVTPLDQLIRAQTLGDRATIDLIGIDPRKSDTFVKQLRALGMDQSALFPEPDSVAADLKRAYRLE